ncbi:DUF6143 family protein [Clostridium tyrobutyricum]|uniref:DUF6143 family protein n=1 Tax=Clostridium tyrobutyricum TaxID=1519 RepID=UPI001C38952A|nr:DUF6143 family protein [Clostridium tyrobutyricum]MBV4429580.1 hypothetical protein [Clostridium tyrobutyricum]MBV4432586.1 hypothetical protein [Clostridium tyrobutyricum]MBV4444822.1 hypothetical protein [Clostridium tyrobutyricum]
MFVNPCQPPSYPMPLYQSLRDKYFVGLSREEFGEGRYAWAGLFNPRDSGVLLFVNVFTVSNVTEIPFSFQVWLNTTASGKAKLTDMQSPSNTAIRPLPKPRIKFLYSENVDAEPTGGTIIFGRRCPAETTIVSEEDGKFICRPGGNFLINCLPPETNNEKILGRIAFGWWEESCI